MVKTSSSPSAPNIRLTITVSPKTHASFKRLADAGSMSISRAMGEWLGDTLDAVEFVTDKLEKARAAPKVAMREMHAYAVGLVDQSSELMDRMRDDGSLLPDGSPPRPVIRGGKSPAHKPSPGGRKS